MLQRIPILDTGFFAKVGGGRREWEEGEGEKRERGAVFDAEGGIPEFPTPKQSFRSSFLPSSSPSSLPLPLLSLLPLSPSPSSFPFPPLSLSFLPCPMVLQSLQLREWMCWLQFLLLLHSLPHVYHERGRALRTT